MPAPFPFLHLDSGPALPKPGRAHVMGLDSYILDTYCVEGNGLGPYSDSPRVRSAVLGATDVQNSDDMGTLRIRASAISDGCGFSVPSRQHHVDRFESRPIPTRRSSPSIADKWVGDTRQRDSRLCSETKSIPEDRSAEQQSGAQPIPEDRQRHEARRQSPTPPSLPRGPIPSPNRSRARNDYDQQRPLKNSSGRQLWTTEDWLTPKACPATACLPPPSFYKANQTSSSTTPPFRDDDSTSVMVPQPETKPISQDQLVAEVKGIYAGLVMVETKCIEVDNAQAPNTDTNTNSKLNNDQWQALIALHRTPLHEHHDFFLASQHPSASPALRRLASKYAMPACMWRHGIHSFLELLRHRLPASLEHMLTFRYLALEHMLTVRYLAHSMVALLYETVPAFEDTWIECLGGLGRYRMAIEDDIVRDRETWTGVSRHWYSKASDRSPTTGRLYHHLAILTRPNALQQLSYFTKSPCVLIPSPSARVSIMTLFDPNRLDPADAAVIKAHEILFSGQSEEQSQESMDEFIEPINIYIGRVKRRWLGDNYYRDLALASILLLYGGPSHVSSFPSVPRLPPSFAWNPFDPHPGASLNDFPLFWKQDLFPVRPDDFATSGSVRNLDYFLRRPFQATLGKRELKLMPGHVDLEPRVSERHMHRTHNPNGFPPGAESAKAFEELFLPACLVHLHEVDCVAARLLAFFHIGWLASVSNLYRLFSLLECVLSRRCLGRLPASALL